MSNRNYLEAWAYKIGFYAYDVRAKPLHKRMDVQAAIRRSLDEREALYKRLNGIQPTLASYWSLPVAERDMVRQERGMR